MSSSSTAVTPSDAYMLKRLRSVISSDGCIPRLDVDVDVRSGIVEVLGVIPDEREHDELLALVACAARTRPVVDHLVVTRPSARRRKHHSNRTVTNASARPRRS